MRGRHTASVQDRDAGRALLKRLAASLRRIRHGGYAGKLATWAADSLKLTIEIVKRSDYTTGFQVLTPTLGG